MDWMICLVSAILLLAFSFGSMVVLLRSAPVRRRLLKPLNVILAGAFLASLILHLPVFYNLGNYWFNTKDLDSCLLEFTFHTQDMENVQVRFIPCRQHDCRTTFYTDPDDHEKALKRMQDISFGTDIDENGVVTERVRE